MNPRPASDTVLIDVKNVSLIVNQHTLLKDISVAIHGGEVISVIGPNGAGKSSLLKLLIGEYSPTSGSLRIEPHCQIGYMPQRLHIEPTLPLTVQRFLSLSGSDAQVITETLDEVDAKPLAQRSIQSLSGGELQRILLTRALLKQPNLLVLDEPTQGVDLHGQREFYRLLSDIRQQRGCGIIQVSHDLHFVMAGTDQVLCLNQHLCCSGSAASVAAHPEYRALFGNAIDESLAIYTHKHDHHHSLDGGVCREHPSS